jgi:hypothetical protein
MIGLSTTLQRGAIIVTAMVSIVSGRGGRRCPSTPRVGLAGRPEKRKDSCPFGSHLGNPGYKSVGQYETR